MRIYRIGIPRARAGGGGAANLDALRKVFVIWGYVEAATLVLEYRSADGRTDRFPALAAELLGLKIDLILAH